IERYIAHALSFESGDTWRITGKPKSRKETPSPSSRASPTARKRKKGSWAAVGVGPPSAGGKSTGSRRKAGTATSTVTIKTLTQVFTQSTPFGSFITGGSVPGDAPRCITQIAYFCCG